MTDANDWPDPSRPGVPLNPERDGWHWLSGAMETPAALEWRFSVTGPPKRGWYLHRAQHGLVYPHEMAHWRYLGPCLAPADVAAQIAEAYARGAEAMRERAASEADCGCDVRSIVLDRLSTHGERDARKCCGQHYDACLALQAAAIRALPLPEMEAPR